MWLLLPSSLPCELKTSLWFCVPLWQSSTVDIANWKQTAETDWECPVLSVPIFPTALKRTITTKGVFLHVSTEEEGLNESWHGFICTAHIINISEKKKLHWANIQITKKSVQVQAMICRWWQQCYIIIWTYSLCSCCIWICFVVKVNVKDILSTLWLSFCNNVNHWSVCFSKTVVFDYLIYRHSFKCL